MRWLLVISQFVCAAAIVLGTDFSSREIWLLVFAIPGAGIAIWAAVTMGVRKVRVMPNVTNETRLVTAGPYRWIRHPMYTGLMLFILPFVIVDPRPWRIVLLIILAITLDCKSRIEERLLSGHFPDYTAYRRASWRFFPMIY